MKSKWKMNPTDPNRMLLVHGVIGPLCDSGESHWWALVRLSWKFPGGFVMHTCFACFAVAPGRAHCLLDAGMAGAFQAKNPEPVSFDRMQIAFRSFMSYKLPLMHAQFLLILGVFVFLHATRFSSCLISQGLFKSPWPDMARHAAARQTGMVKCQWKAMRNLRPSIRSKGWLQRRHLNEVVQCVLMCSLKPCLLKLQRYPLPVEIARVCYSSWNDFTWCHFFWNVDFCWFLLCQNAGVVAGVHAYFEKPDAFGSEDQPNQTALAGEAQFHFVSHVHPALILPVLPSNLEASSWMLKRAGASALLQARHALVRALLVSQCMAVRCQRLRWCLEISMFCLE